MQQELKKIVGIGVTLRPITFEDTALIIKWRNNTEVMKNFIFQEIFTEEMHKNWMQTRVLTGKVIQYIIEDNTTQQPIGSVYIRDIDNVHQSAEYGIFIGENAARGKGYGTETAKLFVEYMFKYLNLHRIFLRVLDGNDAACKSYEKAGFVKEGVFHDMVKINGVYRDVIFMAKINKKEVIENE